MATMVHKVGKYTRRGHRAHTQIGYLRGGAPLANGGNMGSGRSSGSRVAGRKRPRRTTY